MTPTSTTAAWNPTPGSNFNQTSQRFNESQRTNETDFKEQRSEYFRTQYDVMTGIRIAGTLGGFFVFVLLTLLYKSKCKKASRIGTPVLQMDSVGLDMDLLPEARLEDRPPSLSLDPPSILMDLGEDEPMRRRHHLPSPFEASPTLLVSTAKDSSTSSTSSDLSLSGAGHGRESSPSLGGGPHDPVRPPSPPTRGRVRKKRKSGGSGMSWLRQSIDIHVIQATPTLSQDGSQLFPRMGPRRVEPSPKRPRDLMSHRASDSGVGRSNPLFLLHPDSLNLKYVDDTSSENIPAGASEEEPDSRSIGSDSVFLFQTGPVTYEEEEEVCKMTLSQARAQVHHRDSFCSSELESVTDYLESQRRRSSSTQTTISDLRQGLRFSTLSPGGGTRTDTSCYTPSSTGFLSPAQPTPSLSPALGNSMTQGYLRAPLGDRDNLSLTPTSPKTSVCPSPSIPSPALHTFLTVNAANVNPNPVKKRSYDALRKSCSLQCDDDDDRLSKD